MMPALGFALGNDTALAPPPPPLQMTSSSKLWHAQCLFKYTRLTPTCLPLQN